MRENFINWDGGTQRFERDFRWRQSSATFPLIPALSLWEKE